MSQNHLQVLEDISASGKKYDWRARKMTNEYLSIAYESIDQHTADRLKSCATHLVYGIASDGRRRLRSANFCRVRLCPICQWRRSLKLFGQMMQVMDYQQRKDPRSYAFLTLTVHNVSMDDLSSTLDKMVEGYRRLMQYAPVKAAASGWYRGLEITHNLDRNSIQYDTYHPHLHVVLAVNPSYFTSRDYISQARWTMLWQKAMKLDYTPIVDIRRINGDTPKAVAEATKYTAKAKDYIILDDWELTVDTVRGLDAALHKRRLIGFGGCLLDARRALSQDDVDDGDLVQTVGDTSDPLQDVYTESYAWHSGYSQFVRDNAT